MAAFLILGLLACFHLERADKESALRDQRERVLREAALLSSKLGAEVNSTFYLVTGLATYIGMHPGLSQEEFARIAAQLIEAKRGLTHIAAAPGMVNRYIFPLEGNEAALGLDYRRIEAQRQAAMRVAEIGEPVVAGPVRLVQGGEAVIGRFPVFVGKETGREFWGIISTPLDTSVLFGEAGLNDRSLSIEVALMGKDGLGRRGEVFYGNGELFEERAVVLPIELISGLWIMAAAPREGWITEAPNALFIRGSTLLLTALLVATTVMVYLYRRRDMIGRVREAQAERVKNRFYANMSHEIRTPLNGILGMAEIIELSAEDEEQRHSAEVIRGSAETLTRLMEDVLELSRREAAGEPIQSKPIEVEPFLNEIAAPLRYQAREKQLAFNIHDVPEKCRRIASDPAALRQILWNLLSNAVKFTSAGEVDLIVREGPDGKVCFEVADTGVGISPEVQEAIFGEFFQEEDSDSRRFPGAGLGLAIVRRFVDQLGGTIRVDSTKGEGTRFSVVLPAEASAGGQFAGGA